MSRLVSFAVAAAVLLMACLAEQPVAPAPRSPSPALTPGLTIDPGSPVAGTPSAAPTDGVLTSDELPLLRPDPATILAVCDPAPGQAFVDGGEDLLGCFDGVELGLRAVQTVTDVPIDRAWLRRPVCSAPPCTEKQRATGTLTAWIGEVAWSTDVDARSRTATIPRSPETTTWPSQRGAVPAIGRPKVPGAPAEVRTRTPLPFCGFAEVGEPPPAKVCFLAAVLAGRPAEIIETFYGTEGGTVTKVSRFPGFGGVISYQNSVDAQARPLPWFEQLNWLHLGIEPNQWSLEPLYGTDRALP